jgi:septal ring factor EnvC (AmiA/AmiB activator)
MLAILLGSHMALAQESVEDRMRDALRQSVAEMRAAQDQAAQAQADLQKAQAEKAALQSQLDAANARLAAAPAIKPADLDALKAQLQAAQQAAAGLQHVNAGLQSKLESQAASAQARDEQSRKTAAALNGVQSAFAACKAANAKLVDVSEDVLHLYESQDFRAVLLKSYEPVLGLARVKLQNIVQQYDDRINAQDYIGPAK